jgi:hypothetical protein
MEIKKEKLRIIVDENDRMKVFMNGKEVKGIRSIVFEKEYDGFATHTIEYVTCASE